LHRVEDRLARVLLGPHACEAARAELLHLPDLARRLSLHALQPVRGVVLERELARVVVFLVAGRGVVGVGVADKSVLERVAVTRRFLRQALEQRLAREAAATVLGPLVVGRQRVVPLLEACELVVGREIGVRLGGALDLRDLVERLVRGARAVVGRIDRLAVELDRLEHASVAGVAVVGDG